MWKLFRAMIAAACCMLLTVNAASGQQSPAPDFIPDYTFQGSQLDRWEAVGEAGWEAQDGIITADAASGPGMLVFDDSYESVAFFTRLRCEGACDAGILFRLHDGADGTDG
ncbi:MAG: hypothetical protein WD205_01525, partial [Rhodothermales bacterium]